MGSLQGNTNHLNKGSTNGEHLVEVRNLVKYYPVRGGLFLKTKNHVKAVDGVSFKIKTGETLGLVGESGCGKTTVGRTILRLTSSTSGEVLYNGRDVLKANSRELHAMRRNMQIIFQDPCSSLDPRMQIAESVGLPLYVHGMTDKKQREKIVVEMLERVGLQSYHLKHYPHEFSGGQLQRIGIARALTLNPKFIVCDEPVSALDVSIEAQILNLLSDLQDEFGLTYLFIAHNLSVVKHFSDRVAVMYLGRIVEMADRNEIYQNHLHPYTQALMSAIPVPDPSRKRNRVILTGDVPSPLNPPSGCRFHTRCPLAMEKCSVQEPEYKEVKPGHWVACLKVA
jgi:peptide/nickel transport system ATP-binding protein/oligopeptide transport system ATP-binding protein